MMAAAATMFAACTQADFVNDIPASAPKAIDFKSPFIGKSTRAENSSANYTLKFSDHHNSFAVWGYKSTVDEPVFNGKPVNVTLGADAGSEIYKYDGLVYWDESANFYQFYAAAPADGHWTFIGPDNDNKDNGHFTRSITLNKDNINQGKGAHLTSLKPETGVNQDLLIAAPCKPAIGETVGLEFIHILSRLNVVVSKKQGLSEEVRTFEVSVRNMNLSGESIRAIINFYKIDVEDILVIYDEMALPVGTIRIRPAGSAGGHNGMKNIIQNLGTDKFKRIRIGIGKPEYNSIDFVLSKPSREEQPLIKEALEKAAKAAFDFIKLPFDNVMSKHN